jgi:hypothetical protein
MKSFNLDAFGISTNTLEVTRSKQRHLKRFTVLVLVAEDESSLNSFFVCIDLAKHCFISTYIWDWRSLGAHGVLRRRAVAWLLHFSHGIKSLTTRVEDYSLKRQTEKKI